MDFDFRLADKDHVTGLVDMARAFHQEDGHPLSIAGQAAMVQIVSGEPLAWVWIAWHGDQRVGYVVLTLGFSIEYGGRDGFIDDLYVAPAARGSGGGGKLLAFAIAEARKLGIRTLHLEVESANARVRRLYASARFESTDRTLMRLTLQQGESTPRG